MELIELEKQIILKELDKIEISGELREEVLPKIAPLLNDDEEIITLTDGFVTSNDDLEKEVLIVLTNDKVIAVSNDDEEIKIVYKILINDIEDVTAEKSKKDQNKVVLIIKTKSESNLIEADKKYSVKNFFSNLQSTVEKSQEALNLSSDEELEIIRDVEEGKTFMDNLKEKFKSKPKKEETLEDVLYATEEEIEEKTGFAKFKSNVSYRWSKIIASIKDFFKSVKAETKEAFKIEEDDDFEKKTTSNDDIELSVSEINELSIEDGTYELKTVSKPSSNGEEKEILNITLKTIKTLTRKTKILMFAAFELLTISTIMSLIMVISGPRTTEVLKTIGGFGMLFSIIGMTLGFILIAFNIKETDSKLTIISFVGIVIVFAIGFVISIGQLAVIKNWILITIIQIVLYIILGNICALGIYKNKNKK